MDQQNLNGTDPNQNNPSSPPPQPAPVEPATQPAPTVQAAVATAPQPSPVTPQTAQPYAPATLPPKKSKKGLIIGLLIGLFVFIAGVVALGLTAWVLFLSPSAQAKLASIEFMDAASKGDKEELYKITESTSEADKQFIDSVASSLKGSYSEIDKTSQNGKWYFLYELKGAQSKYARTIVQKDAGEYSVASIVFGNEKLALIPGDAAVEPAITESTATPQACLAQDDYKWMNYNKEPGTVTYDSTIGENTINYETKMFFEADSIQEQSFSSIYDDWAEFATKNADKQWRFILKGEVNDGGNNSVSDPASVKLAEDRANEVKRELTSRGVSEAKITIIAPTDNSKMYLKGTKYEAQNTSIFRSVQLIIDPTCSAS